MTTYKEENNVLYALGGLVVGVIAGIIVSTDANDYVYTKPAPRKETFVHEYIEVPVNANGYAWWNISVNALHTTFRDSSRNLRHKLVVGYRGYTHEVIADSKQEAIDAMSTLLSK